MLETSRIEFSVDEYNASSEIKSVRQVVLSKLNSLVDYSP